MTNILECKHEKASFFGAYSLVGYYLCDHCQLRIDPVEYAKSKGMLNIALIDYYTQNPEKLNPMWRDHNWVRHLYV